MKNSRLTVLFAPLLALVLELLPWGTVVYFFDPALGRYRNVYSYFSLVPFGYANVGPFFTALATCVLLVLLILYVFKGKRSVLLASTGVSCVAFLVSLTAMPYGVTMVGVWVTVMLLVSSVLLIFVDCLLNFLKRKIGSDQLLELFGGELQSRVGIGDHVGFCRL